MGDELVSLLSKRIADLRAEAGEEFCNCESYDKCYGECCGIGNCTCTPAVGSGSADATPDGPHRWALPDEPGPEVTAVRDQDGCLWRRVHNGWQMERGPGRLQPIERWWKLVSNHGPVTDATPAADGQDGRDG